GLKGEHPRTLEEVAKRFGVTRERIRQIEAKALAKLQAIEKTRSLRNKLQ
ncbi:MAG: sigma factor-like helix-turn-helix DNA-binding protein, partial [Anaerolineae bacterium]